MEPGLIEDFVPGFLKLLSSKNNRLVWGVMITLAMVADKRPKEVLDHLKEVIQAIEKGSIITRDNGIKTLAAVAAVNKAYNAAIFPFLIDHLKTCRPKSVPQYAESVLRAVTAETQEQYVAVLNQQYDALASSQQRRVKKLLKTFEGAK